MRVTYMSVSRDKLPEELRFDVPREHQGQTIEVAYADYPTEAGEACNGAKYRRETDRSDGATTYYERV
jgi:hypothetical protein